jgi:hypothetical protein
MITDTDEFLNYKTWCPAILVIAIFMIAFIPRIFLLSLLPLDAIFAWHPLHKIQKLLAFK